MKHKPLILGIGGAPFADSSSERALKISLAAAAAQGAETQIFAGPDLVMPLYDPRDPARDPKQTALLHALRRCDGLIISTPAYHGSVSGLIKNALDYIEDLRTDERVYLDGVAVGLIVCAGGWQAAGPTLTALRSIAHSLRGWPTPLGATLNTASRLFGDDGECLDLPSQTQLVSVGRQVVGHARLMQSAPSPAAEALAHAS